MYQDLYQWARINAPDWQPLDLPVVPLAGFLETGIEVRCERRPTFRNPERTFEAP